MSDRPTVGEEVQHEVTVTREMTARLFDREIHPVYATAWMVRHVEEAGRLLVERHLGPGEDATGYRIDLTHERPVPVGARVAVRGRVSAVDSASCTITFEVSSGGRVVGRGSFVQRYVAPGRLGATPEEGLG
jgi:fluoroacetyl-CoA thioesterase